METITVDPAALGLPTQTLEVNNITETLNTPQTLSACHEITVWIKGLLTYVSIVNISLFSNF